MAAAILDHIWQSTLFATLAALMTLAFRTNKAGVRFWLWFAASAKFLVPFAALVAAGDWLSSTLLPAHAAPAAFDGVLAVIAPFGAIGDAAGNYWLWLACLWALGSAAFAALWFVRAAKLNKLVNAAWPVDMPAPMPVLSSAAAMEPGLVGVFKAKLILPDGIVDRLSPAQMKAMLTHEICHLERRDNLTAAIHMIVEAAFWFHPLVWWIGARMIEERERACDETVVASGNEPQIYAEGLLEVCRHYLQSPLACAAGISGAGLKKRMEEIMADKTPTALTGIKRTALAAAAIAALAIPLALGVMSAPAMAQGEPIKGAAWLERPGAAEFDRFYPADAVAQKLDGRAVLDCSVLSDGHLKCAIKSESPEGAGFGQAALNIAPKFKMAAKDKDGKNTAGRSIMIPISFRLEAQPVAKQ